LILAIPAIVPEWFFSTPASSDQVNVEELIAIASIAAITWTGGLIAFQVRELASELTASLSLLRFAFLAPLLALIANGPVIRFAAMLFGFYAFRESITSGFVLLVLRLIRRLTRVEKFMKNVDKNFPALLDLALPELGILIVANLILLAAYVAVFVYPSHLLIASAAIVLIFSGVQYIAAVLKPERAEKLEKLKHEMDLLKSKQTAESPITTPTNSLTP